MKQGLLQILRDIFSSAGYNVTESYRYDMVAEKNGYKTLIKLAAHPDYADIKNFADQITDGKGLYAATHSMADDLYQYATENGLMVWDRDDIALYIGKAVLADIEGNTADLELIPPVEQQASNKIINEDFESDVDNSIFGIFGQSDAPKQVPKPRYEPKLEGKMSTQHEYSQPRTTEQHSFEPRTTEQHSFEPQTSELHSFEPRLSEPRPPMILNLHAAPLNVSKDHVINIAKQHVGIVDDVTLKFVPFWQYKYSINVAHQYKSKIVDISGNGVGCLNALNGNHENIEIIEVHDNIEVPNEEYEVKGPILTHDEANRNLLESLIAEHTKEIRFDSMVGDTIISEHKLFKPTIEDVYLDISMIYLPIWELKGRRNSVEINGYNAEVLCNPVDDDVEFI